MTIITSTPDAATATVRITLENAAGVTGIRRSDANGSRLVRLRTGELPAAGALTITDYEPALSGRIQYRTIGAESDPVWTEVGAELPRFILPSIPYFFVEPDLVHGYSAGRSSRSTFHDVIGREDPLVAEARLSTRSGLLDVWFPSYMAAKDLEDLLTRGQTVMYRQAEHAGMDMYFHALSTDVAPDEDAWKLSLSYREILYPAGNVLASASWTFAALAASGGSFDAVAERYRTFHDLAINEPTP